MGSDNLEYQYTDLHNFPDIIVRCIKKGMVFNGNTIIGKYYEEAFSIYHYKAMQKFEDVFQEEYDAFFKTYFPCIKKWLKNTILSELEFLDESGMDMQLDILIDDIPEILKEFGVRYTKKFRQQVIWVRSNGNDRGKSR